MWIKVINLHRYTVNNIRGFLPTQMVQFLMHLHPTPSHRVFFLSRHGQSEYNQLGKIGGDSGLSFLGKEYAKKLGKFCDEQVARNAETGEDVPTRLWTSTLRRTIETSDYIPSGKVLDDTWYHVGTESFFC